MIIFINGAFGVGKSSVATTLEELLPHSMIFDPEEVGFMLRNILGRLDWPGDFQEYPAWRSLVPIVAEKVREGFEPNLIIPMTIKNVDYFDEIKAGLMRFDPDFNHFCLIAPRDEILTRVQSRDEADRIWVETHVDSCIESHIKPEFASQIDTLGKTPRQIAEEILDGI